MKRIAQLLFLFCFVLPLTAQTPGLLLVKNQAGGTAPFNPPPVGGTETIPFGVNCGGPVYASVPLALTFSADRGFTGGSAGDNEGQSNAGGDAWGQTLGQSGRYLAHSYAFTVTNATYRVTLLFVESYKTIAAARLFNVAIEGSTVLTAYDIFADAGGTNIAVAKAFVTTVSDGTLNIALTDGSISVPVVMAILVEAYVAAAPAAIANLAITAGDGQASVTFTPAPNSTQTNVYVSTDATVTTGDTKTANIQSGHVIAPLTNGVQIWAKVEAENAAGVSALSNLVTATPAAAPTTGINLYVSTTGLDSNPGTSGSKFLTLARAQAEIRTLTSRTVTAGAPPLGWQGATIHVAAGTYAVTAEWVLDGRDSGDSSFPIRYEADTAGTVVLSGAKQVSNGAWSAVTSADTYAWGRIDAAYRADCFKLDVAALGIDTGVLTNGNSMDKNMLMLIVNGSLRLMSRYPEGDETTAAAWKTITGVTGGASHGAATTVDVSGNVISDWNITNQDILAYGVWGKAWAVEWDRITSISASGFFSRLSFTRTSSNAITVSDADAYVTFIAMRNQLNVMQKGSYAWNRTNGMIYYRPNDAEGSPVSTSLTLLPTVMRLGVDGDTSKDANYVTFDGIVFEGSRSFTIQGFHNTGLNFTDCELRNSGHAGWRLEKQTDLTVSGGSTHDITVRAGYLHGGNKATLTDANIVISGHTIDDIGCYAQANVSAALSLVTFSKNGSNVNSCGVLVENCTISNCRDGAIGLGGPNTIMRGCTIDRPCMLTGDAGGVTILSPDAAAYSMTNIDTLIEDNDFTNLVRHPLHNASRGALFMVYAESCSYWTLQDNRYVTCDQAMNIAAGKNMTVRREKFTDCHLGHYTAPVVFGGRVGYIENETSLEQDFIDFAVQNEPFLSAAPRLTAFRAGQPENAVMLYHDDIVCVDNMSNGGTKMFRQTSGSTWATVSGFQIGVDPTQLNYPLGATGTPVLGGGTVPISDLDN